MIADSMNLDKFIKKCKDKAKVLSAMTSWLKKCATTSWTKFENCLFPIDVKVF